MELSQHSVYDDGVNKAKVLMKDGLKGVEPPCVHGLYVVFGLLWYIGLVFS